jgi:hypothetical protein
MDLKEPGNLLYLVGLTRNELGGSHFALIAGLDGGEMPKVDAAAAKQTFAAMHQAIHAGLVRACHDLSEGGLAVAAAEMAFAGGLGAKIRLDAAPLLSPACGRGAGGEGVFLPSPFGRGAGGEGVFLPSPFWGWGQGETPWRTPRACRHTVRRELIERKFARLQVVAGAKAGLFT